MSGFVVDPDAVREAARMVAGERESLAEHDSRRWSVDPASVPHELGRSLAEFQSSLAGAVGRLEADLDAVARRLQDTANEYVTADHTASTQLGSADEPTWSTGRADLSPPHRTVVAGG